MKSIHVQIREDTDGNDITFNRDHVTFATKEDLKEYEEHAGMVLSNDPTAAILFQEGAVLEIPNKSSHYMGLQVIGVGNDRKIKKKFNLFKWFGNFLFLTGKPEKRRIYGFLHTVGNLKHEVTEKTELACTFICRLVCTGVPG